MKKKSFFCFFYKKIIIFLVVAMVVCGIFTYILNKEILLEEIQASVTEGYEIFSRIDLVALNNSVSDENEYDRNWALFTIRNNKNGSVLINDSGEIIAPIENQAILRSTDNICAVCSTSYFEEIDYFEDYLFMINDFYINGNKFLPGNIEVYKFEKGKGTTLIETVDLTPNNTEGYTHITDKPGAIVFSVVNYYDEKFLEEDLPQDFEMSEDIHNASVYYKSDKGFMKYVCYEYLYNTVDMESYTLINKYTVDVWDLGKIYFIPIYVGFILGSVIISAFIALLDFKRYEKLRYQRTLTSSLAHDLKSPLMVISGYVENITENVNPEKNDKYIQAIGQNVNHMNDIIINIMELNELQEKKKGLMRKENCDISLIFEAAFKRNQSLMEKRNIKSEITGYSLIKCNQSAFARAIDNLINNAIIHSSEGKTVEVIMGKNDIVIRNHYENIIKNKPKQLVEPFVKGDDSRSKGGTGLGLCIAKTIMDMHNFKMEIKLDSSIFEVRIKL